MLKKRYNRLCFSCSVPISSVRSDRVYCSEKCATYSTRMRLKYMPELTTKQWIEYVEAQILSIPLEELSHPVKLHPINKIAPKLRELQEQLIACLPTAAEVGS